MENEDLPKMWERSGRFWIRRTKEGGIKGLRYPIVDTLCDLGFRNRFFAVSCWTKFLDGCEVSV